MSQLENRPSRARDTDRKTRIHLSFYDRTKFFLLFGITFLVLVWSNLAENPILSFSDGVKDVASSKSWLLGLVVIEVFLAALFLFRRQIAASPQ